MRREAAVAGRRNPDEAMITAEHVASIEEDLAKIMEMDQATVNGECTDLTPQRQAFLNDRDALLKDCRVSANQLQDADRRYREHQAGVAEDQQLSRILTVEQCAEQVIALQEKSLKVDERCSLLIMLVRPLWRQRSSRPRISWWKRISGMPSNYKEFWHVPKLLATTMS